MNIHDKIAQEKENKDFRNRCAIQSMTLFELNDTTMDSITRGQQLDNSLIAKFCFNVAEAMLLEKIKRDANKNS